LLAVDVMRQPDGAVNVAPLAVLTGVSAEMSSMLESAGCPAAAPAKPKERATAKIRMRRIQLLHNGTLAKKLALLATSLRRSDRDRFEQDV
jgi:hypothetical protein